MAQTIDQLVIELRADINGLKAGLSSANSEVKRFSGQSASAINGFEVAVRRAGAAFGTYFGARTLASIGNAVFDAGVQFESLKNKMQASVGSSAAAADAMKFSREEAERLGLVFTDLANGYASFSAAALRAGLSTEEVRGIFVGVSEAATAMQLSQERVSLVFQALSQMASKGVVSMEELRQQLGESLPGAVQIFAKAMGVSNGEFIKLVEQGKVSARELTKLGAALHEQFGDAAVRSADSARAAVNRFTNALFDLKNTAANGDFMRDITDALESMTRSLSDPKVQQGFTAIMNGLGEMAKLGALVVSFVGALAGRLADDLTPALTDAAEAQRQLNAAMKDALSYNQKTDSFGTSSPDRAKTNGELFGKPGDEKAAKKAASERARLAEQVEALKYSLANETEQAAFEYEKRQKLLEEALKKKAITEEEFRQLSLESELEHKNRYMEIYAERAEEEYQLQQDANDAKRSMQKKAFDEGVGLLEVFAQKNKAIAAIVIAIEKARAIAAVLIAGQEAGMKAAAAVAYAGPGAAAAAYGSMVKLSYVSAGLIAAQGIAQVAMMGAGGSGGGSSGSYSGSSSGGSEGASQGQQVSQRKDINLTIQGSYWGPQDVRNLVVKLNEYMGDGTVRLNVAGVNA